MLGGRARLFCYIGQVDRLLGSFHGFGKPPRLRIGGGQRVENGRLPPAGKLYHPFGLCDRRRRCEPTHLDWSPRSGGIAASFFRKIRGGR